MPDDVANLRAPALGAPASLHGLHVERSRIVRVDLETLADIDRSLRAAAEPSRGPGRERAVLAAGQTGSPGRIAGGLATVGHELQLTLFDDVVETALVMTRETTLRGGVALSGELADDPFSSFTIVTNGDAVAGMVWRDGVFYELETAGDGLIAVREILDVPAPDFNDDLLIMPEEMPVDGRLADQADDAAQGRQRAGPEARETARGDQAASDDADPEDPTADPEDPTADPEDTASDRAALVALFDNTGGSTSWLRTDNWGSESLDDWYGVTVENGRVTRLELARNNLRGRIPVDLGDLDQLKVLDLSENVLSGPLPDIFASMTSLTELLLGGNPALSGELPVASLMPLPLTSVSVWSTEVCLPGGTDFLEGRSYDGLHCRTSTSDSIVTVDVGWVVPRQIVTDYGRERIEFIGDTIAPAVNRFFSRSQIPLRLRLVGMYEHDYGAVQPWTISQLANRDGIIDDVLDWRDEVGADIVVLWGDHGWNFSGRAMISLGRTSQGYVGYPERAFATINGGFGGATVFVVAHEIGHIFGLRHDRRAEFGFVDDPEDQCAGSCTPKRSPFVYGVGAFAKRTFDKHARNVPKWRTVMTADSYGSYNCSSSHTFSNPAVTSFATLTAQPLGNPALTNTRYVYGPADASRVFAWTRDIVAGYRTGQGGSVYFGTAAATATEGGAAAVLTVHLDPPPRLRTSVGLSVVPLGTTSPADFAAPTTVVFAPGEGERTVEIRALDDDDDDDGEQVSVRFAGLPGHIGSKSPDAVVVSLVDNDGGSSTGMRLHDTAVFENRGHARFGVALDTSRDTELVVSYSTADGSATTWQNDYVAAQGRLTIAAGATQGEIAVPVLADDALEPQETFSVTAVATLDANEVRATATGTILDTGGPPPAPLIDTVAVPADWALIPDDLADSDDATFRLLFVTAAVRDATSSDIDTYNRFVQDRAAGGSDALAPYATGFRAVGRVAGTSAAANTGLAETSGDTAIPVYWLGGDRVVADSADLLSGSWQALTPVDGAGAAHDASCPLADIASCVFTGEDSNALDGWVLGGGTNPLLAAPGPYVTVGRPKVAGLAIDADELAVPEMRLPFYGLSPVFRVQAGEVLPRVTVGNAAAQESAGAITFTAALDRAATSEVTVAYATVDGTALAGDDYVARSGRVRFAVGEVTKEVTVTLVQDAKAEVDEYFELVLGLAQNARVTDNGAVAKGKIGDDVELPLVSVLEPLRPAMEAAGMSAVFGVALQGTATGDVTLDYETVPGTAADTTDYTHVEGTLTLSPAATPASIAVPLVDDDIFENSERFGLVVSEVRGARLAGAEAFATIVDDDHPEAEPAPGAYGVSATWPLVPAGLRVGDEFHLLFVTSGERDGTSAQIGDYNDFVRRHAAAGHAQIRASARRFSAVAGTASWPEGATVFANTGTTPTRTSGRPVYWLGGSRVAPHYAAFFDAGGTKYAGSHRWQSRAPVDENGAAVERNCVVDSARHVCVYTGFNAESPMGGTTGYSAAGVPTLDPPDGPEPALDHRGAGTFTAQATHLPLYALSPAYRVMPANRSVPRIDVQDRSAAETTDRNFIFTAQLSKPADLEVRVDYETISGTAIGSADALPGDFVSAAGTLVIPSGARLGQVFVGVVIDRVNELDETFEFRLSNPVNATLGRAVAIGTIRPGVIQLDATVGLLARRGLSESSGQAEFTVTLSKHVEHEVTVDYTTVPGTALPGEDYVATAGTLTLAPRTLESTVQVALIDDDVYEPGAAETFTLRLSNLVGGFFSHGNTLETTTSILDDEVPPTPVATLSVASYAIAEGDSLDVTVALDRDPVGEGEVVVPLVASGVRGGNAADWSGIPQGLTFGNGAARSQTFAITATDDAEDDDGEGLVLRFGQMPAGVVAGDPSRVTVYIADNDGAGISLSTRQIAVAEGGNADYRVALLAPPRGEQGEVVVAVGGTAGTDLSVTPGRLTFDADNWQTEQTVAVTAAEDDDAVADTPVPLTHSGTGPGYESVVGPVVVAVIEEDDRAQVYWLQPDITAAEAGGDAEFVVALSVHSTAPVSVDYRTVDGTARAPGDYAAATGTLRFDESTTRRTIRVDLRDDAADEPETETFSVILENLGNADLRGSATATGRIEDDDVPEVTASFATDVYAVTEGGPAAQIAVRLDQAPERRLRLPLAATGLDGAEQHDYVVPDVVTFAADESAVTFELSALDDFDNDDGEGVLLRLHDLPAGVAPGAHDTATVHLNDRDEPALVLSDAAVSVPEDGQAEYTVALSTRPATPVTVTLDVPSGALAAAPLWLTYTADDWDEPQTVTLTAPADADLAQAPPVVLSHTGLGGDYSGLTAALTVTLVENDRATVSVADVAAAEGAGHLAFVVALDQPAGVEVVVAYATDDLAATAPGDYVRTVGQLRFASGVARQTIRVPLVDDDVNEPEETITLTLSEPRNARFPADAATIAAQGTIRDDDSPVVAVSFAANAYAASEGGTAARVSVRVDRDPERTLLVPLTATPAAGASPADYRAPVSVTFAPGGPLTQTFTVDAIDDRDDEGDETVTLAFSLPDRTEPGAIATAVVHLVDNDGRGIVLSNRGPRVPEGDTATYTVALASRPTDEVTVTVVVPSGTDLSATPGVLTFARDAWATPQPVTLQAAPDDDLLADAPVTVDHAARGGGYDGEAAQATATIVESDRPTVSVDAARGTEGAGQVAFEVRLDRAAGAAVMLDYATADGTATAPQDYVETRGTLRFPAGATSRTIRVPVRDDDVDDTSESETFSLTLSNLRNARFEDAADTVRVDGTIADDDTPRVVVSFAAAVYSAAEGGATAAVRVRVDRDPERLLSVPLTVSGTASAADYRLVPESVEFPAGGPVVQTLVVAAVDDHDDDDGETVVLRLGELPARTSAGRPTESTVHLVDNDGRGLEVLPQTIRVRPGVSKTYTVRLQTSPTATVTVTVAVPEGVGLAVSPLRLEFTTADWSARRTLTLSAVARANSADVEIVHTAAGGDYDGLAASITARRPGNEPVVSVSSVTADEGDGDLVFTVTLDRPGEEVAVDYATVDHTATAPADYAATRGTLQFSSGTQRAIRVHLADDGVAEPDSESFRLVLSNASNARFVGGGRSKEVTGTIRDDDRRIGISLDAGAANVLEAGVSEADPGRTAKLRIRLHATPRRALTVPLRFTYRGGATPADYEHIPLQVSFDPHTRVRILTVQAIDDRFDDDGESFTVSLDLGALPQTRLVGQGLATYYIADDDIRAVHAEPSTVLVREAGEAAGFDVWLGTQPGAPVTVSVDLPGGTDLDRSPATLTFTASDFGTPQRIGLTATSDADAETDDPVTLRLSATGADYDGQETAVVARILEKDRPVFGADPVTVAENAATAALTVTLDREPTRPATVDYVTAGGTAEASADFTQVSGTLTFGVGETRKSVTVPILTDDVDEEEEEHFDLVLSNPVNADLPLGAPDMAVPVTLVDDDDPRVTISYGPTTPLSVLEGDATSAMLLGNIDDAGDTRVKVLGEFSDFEYKHVDYERYLAFSRISEVATRFVTGPHRRGYVLAGIEIMMRRFNAQELTSAGNVVYSHVLDTRRSMPAVELVRGPRRGTGVVLTLEADSEVEAIQEVAAQMFRPPTGTVLDPGTTYWLRIRLADESYIEASIPGRVTPLWSWVGLTAGGLDAGSQAEWYFRGKAYYLSTAGPTGLPEAGPIRMRVHGHRFTGVDVTVSLDRDPERELTIPVTSTPMNGASTADYFGVPETLTFAAGGPIAKGIRLGATDDAIDDDDEAVLLDFGPGALPERVQKSASPGMTVNIIDNDMRGLALSSGAHVLDEGKVASYTVALTSEPTAAVRVSITPSLDGVVTATPATLTFHPADWSTPQAVAVSAPVDEDALDPATVTLSHTASGGDYVGVASSATVRVVDTTAVLFSLDETETSVMENAGPATLTVRIDQASSRAPTVRILSDDGDGTAYGERTAFGSRPGFAGDYGSVDRRLTFAPDQPLMQTVEIAIDDDDLFEENETFDMLLVAPENGALKTGAARAAVTIENDERPPVYVAFGHLSDGPLPRQALPPFPLQPVMLGNLGGSRDGGTQRVGGDRIGGSVGTGAYVAVAVKFRSGTNYATQSLGGIGLRVVGAPAGVEPIVVVAESPPGLGAPSGVARIAERGELLDAQDCDRDGFDHHCIELSRSMPLVPDEVNYFEAPPGARLEPDTDYTLVLGTATDQSFSVAMSSTGQTRAWPGWRTLFSLELPGDFHKAAKSDAPLFRIVGRGTVPSTRVLLAIEQYRIDEHGGASTLEVTAGLNSRVREVDTIVTLSLGAPGDMAVSGEDYAAATATVVIPAGAAHGKVELTVTPIDDADKELDETVSIAGTTADLSVAPVVFRIVDDDRAEALGTDLHEGQYADVTVTLSRDPERTVEVPIEAAGYDGASPADYTVAPTVTFDAGGQLMQTLRVTAQDDRIDDDGEGVALGFGGLPAGVTAIAPHGARIDIVDDDRRGVLVTPTSVDVEEGGTATYEVELGSEPTAAVEVRVDGADLADTDLTSPTSGLTLTFTPANWDVPQFVTLETRADTDGDTDAPILFTHTAHGGGYDGAAVPSVTLRILETTPGSVDPLGVSFGSASYQAWEGGQDAIVAVLIDADPTQDVVVPLHTAPGGEATAGDFSGVPSALTFTLGGARVLTFSVTATDDAVDDDGGTVALTFGVLPAGVTQTLPQSAVVRLIDDDAGGVLLSSATATVTEGGQAAYTVRLASAPLTDVTVSVDVPQESDMSASPALLTFSPSTWSTEQDGHPDGRRGRRRGCGRAGGRGACRGGRRVRRVRGHRADGDDHGERPRGTRRRRPACRRGRRAGRVRRRARPGHRPGGDRRLRHGGRHRRRAHRLHPGQRVAALRRGRTCPDRDGAASRRQPGRGRGRLHADRAQSAQRGVCWRRRIGDRYRDDRGQRSA